MASSSGLSALSVARAVQSRSVGTTFINSHHFRFAVIMSGFTEEKQGGGIPLRCQQEINDLARCIDCPVQVFPLTFDFDVGFVHSSPTTHGAFTPPKRLIQCWKLNRQVRGSTSSEEALTKLGVCE